MNVQVSESTPLAGVADRPHDRISGPLASFLARATAVAAWVGDVPDRVFLGAMLALAVVIQVPRLWSGYWSDEAISIGIAEHSFGQIPRYLHFDGSPPLYYVLLHTWMLGFGQSAPATHVLSLLASLAAVPVAWLVGRWVFGPQASRPAAALTALSPYLAYYGTETRMYVMVGLFSLIAVPCFVKALQAASVVAQRAGDGRRGFWEWLGISGRSRRWLVGAIGASVVLLYLHNWSLFLVAGLVVIGLASAWWWRDLGPLRVTGCYLAVVVGCYAPWVPSLLYQLHHTGAPWAPHPGVDSLFVDPFRMVSFGSWWLVLPALAVGVGALVVREAWHGGRPSVGSAPGGRAASQPGVGSVGRSGVGAVGGSGVGTVGGSGGGAVGRPGVRTVRRPGMVYLAALVATLVIAWLGSQLVRSWDPRYLGIVVVPSLALIGGALWRTRLTKVCVVVVALAMAGTAVPYLTRFDTNVKLGKSNAVAALAVVRPTLRAGDLVIAAETSQLPVLAQYLKGVRGLRYANSLGLVKDPFVVNWKEVGKRTETTQVSQNLQPLLARVPVGGHVLLVDPSHWSAADAYDAAVEAQGIGANQAVLNDPDLMVTRTVSVPHGVHPSVEPITAVLLTRTG